MTPLFKKLNFKNHQSILICNAPDSFNSEMEAMTNETSFYTTIEAVESIEFVMVFATQLHEIETSITALLPKLNDDALLWFCYPKGTSKKYKCEFNRDNGWAVIGGFGYEPVRMVAIDADWSALRFRKTTFIKKLTRNPDFTISIEGKARTQK